MVEKRLEYEINDISLLRKFLKTAKNKKNCQVARSGLHTKFNKFNKNNNSGRENE